MAWGDVVSLGGLILAVAAFIASLRATRKKEATEDRLSAIDGFDKLTRGQGAALAETEKKLKETRDELRKAEQRIHDQDDKIDDQDRKIVDLERQVASLERHVATLEGKAP